MSLALVVLLLVMMPIVSFAPGFVLVRRMRRWSALEKFAASIAASIVLVYLVAFLIYNTVIAWSLAWVYTGVSVGALVWCWRDARRLFAVPQVRRVAWLFAALFGWNLLMLGIIRNYVGAFWGPDWYEHYERSLHFVERGPDLYRFLNAYLLPARPPLMNLFSAFFLAQVGTEFVNYQVTFAFLNLLPFIPLALLLPLLARRGSRYVGLLAALLACNPMFMHNAQFTWTKAATGVFVALGVWFYLVGWRRGDRTRMSLAFLSLSAGALVHYSGAPYAVALGLHYVVSIFWSRRQKARDLLGIAVPAAALLASWVGYSLSAYGFRDTFATNSAVSDSRDLSLVDNLWKIGTNIVNTLVPHLARGYWVERNEDVFRQLVDNAFYIYQVNLPFALGLTGSFVVLFLLFRVLRNRSRRAAERVFWFTFIALAVILSIAVVGPPDDYGVAHIGLQPLVQLGVAFLAANLPRIPRTLRGLMLAGIVVDFVFGIAIHVYMEASVAEWASDYNMEVKTRESLVFLGDWMPGLAVPFQAILIGLFLGLLVYSYRTLSRFPEVDGT